MKIEFKVSDFLKALNVVSIINPRSVIHSGGSGYLFSVKGKECYIYSRDDNCVVRSVFNLINSDGDGQFVYPAEYIGAFKYIDDELCVMESTNSDGKFSICYHTESGVESEKGSFDPQLLASCDDDLDSCSTAYVFQAGVLKEAINLSKSFLGKVNDTMIGEQFKGLQIMDASYVNPDKGIDYSKGDGYLFVCDSIRLFFFQCDDFKGKSLEIHGQHLGLFTNFLSKCDTKVTIKKGNHFTFAVGDNGCVFGWIRHHKLYDKFNYYSLKVDNMVFIANKLQFMNAIQHARSEMNQDSGRVKLNFDLNRRCFWFGVSEGTSKTKGIPIPLKVLDGMDLSEFSNFSFFININHISDLVSQVKGNDVEFRCAIKNESKKAFGLFRTIDEFCLDVSGKLTTADTSFKCRVTRCMPTKN